MSLSQYGVIESISPVGGWRYSQALPDGQASVRIPAHGCAGGPNELVRAVKNFRAVNNLDLGDVERDVAAFIVQASPISDRFRGRKPIPEPEPANKAHRSYIERARDWLLVLTPKRPKLVIPHDAQPRVEVCAACPQNVKWQTGCLPCCEEITQASRNLRRRATFEGDKDLRFCRLHGVMLDSAVFLDKDFLPARDPQAPAECWMPTPP